MTFDEFVALVSDMRAAQKEYFLTRNGTALSKSKKLEKEVDYAIGICSGTVKPRQEQKNLF